jgi:DNA-binding SARP family transcriptional activator
MGHRSDSLAKRLRDTVMRHGRQHPRRSDNPALSPAELEVDLLGGRLLKRGVPVHVPPAALAVVIALAVKDRSVARDDLADELYPGADPAAAAGRLKVNVHRVKRYVETADIICNDAGRYSLGWCVHVGFRRMEAFVRPLSNEHGLTAEARSSLVEIRRRLRSGRPQFMLAWPWFDDMERRLCDLEYEATVLLGEDALRDGRYDDAVALADEMLRADPLDEIASEMAVRAAVLCRNDVGAALHYRRYEKRLNGASADSAQLWQGLGRQSAAG